MSSLLLVQLVGYQCIGYSYYSFPKIVSLISFGQGNRVPHTDQKEIWKWRRHKFSILVILYYESRMIKFRSLLYLVLFTCTVVC